MSFLFWLKEKPVEIIAYIHYKNTGIKEFFPIAPAIEHLPQWWKNLPRSSFNWDNMEPRTTVKNCPGIITSYKKSFILPMWSDLAIKINTDTWRYQFASHFSEIEQHSDSQTDKFYSDYVKFKLVSPWILNSPVACHYSFPFYNYTEPTFYESPHGIVQPLRNALATNVFMFIKKPEEEKRYFVKAGSPMMQITPLTEKPVKVRCEVVSNEDFIKQKSIVDNGTFFYARGLKHLSSEPSIIRTTKAEPPK